MVLQRSNDPFDAATYTCPPTSLHLLCAGWVCLALGNCVHLCHRNSHQRLEVMAGQKRWPEFRSGEFSSPQLPSANDAQLARWVGIEVVSLVIEVLILGLATYIILMLQMSMRSKCKVIFAFMTRLPYVSSFPFPPPSHPTNTPSES